MISEEVVRKILESGILAPSGENAQPWLFKVDKNTISLFNNPDSDQSLYNYRQSGSFVANGACIENMAIAAAGFGFGVDVEYFPEKELPNFVALITLHENNAKRSPLEDALSLRATNRKTYDGSPLTEAERVALLDIPHIKQYPARVVMVESRDKIAALAKAASFNERMLVENPKVHDFFFAHVRWTDEENRKHPKGFYIDTLELKPPQVAAFKLLRSPFAARILSALGMSKVVGNDNEKIYNTASAMFGIVAKNNTPFDLVMAGRIFEHIWLTATKLGLSLQPTTGALFLAEGIRGENRDSFSISQQRELLAARESVYDTLEVHAENEYVVVLFRVGRGGEPSARAARFPLEHFLI